MEAIILSSKMEGTSTSYVCELSLKDFVDNLPPSFMNYDIQRGVVSNIYLDNLIDTVLAKSSIPPITLVAEEANVEMITNHVKKIDIKRYKILDGLQRTFRLKTIWDTITFFTSIKTDEVLEYNKFKLSRTFGKELQKINSSTIILQKIINFYKHNGNDELLNTFTENKQWFIVWENLSPEKQVEKMLILNAGHKPVSIRHQLELLFINLKTTFEQNEQFSLVREKEMSSIVYAKKREKGQFHFAHLISSILSFANGETITTNASLINKLQEDENKIDKYKQYFTYDFLNSVVTFLIQLDNLLESQYGETGTQWLGRETVMVGIFGAVGRIYQEKENYLTYAELFEKLLNLVRSNNHILNLNNYNEFRNNMNLSKVNVGNVSKRAIFEGIYNLVKNDLTTPIEWYEGE